jgi:maltose O-acetyltransferase
VVTRDIPPGVIAAGVPCRVVRAITEGDRTGFGGGAD